MSLQQDKPFSFSRAESLQRLAQVPLWDVLVIGGGATGLGIAVDAASRGLKTLLLEASDFAKGTSSRSTKLVHGGVRYLAQGNIKLVFEALRERGYLLRNAPHLVARQSFVIPCYNHFEKVKYWTGLKFYDWLSVGFSFGTSQLLSKEAVVERLPGVRSNGLTGGILYFDGQFDDARLAVNLAQTASREGACVLNYVRVKKLVKSGGKISGVVAAEEETGMEYNISARVVLNATGVFVDDVLQQDDPGQPPMVRVSQGIHLVLDSSFLPGTAALMIPQTSDGRVLFALPWHDHLLVGTTDTPLKQHSTEPIALEEEINFVLDNVRQYLTRQPSRGDVLSVFAGLRPLVAPQHQAATKEISRDHKLFVSHSGLITITGGKWTTYRKMAEDAVDSALQVGGLGQMPSRTKSLAIHGHRDFEDNTHLAAYGTDAAKIKALTEEQPQWSATLVDGHPYTYAEVIWAVRGEMACTIEDVLARRVRLLFLDARAALQAAPKVAMLMAAELAQDDAWIEQQLLQFNKLAKGYLPAPVAADLLV